MTTEQHSESQDGQVSGNTLISTHRLQGPRGRDCYVTNAGALWKVARAVSWRRCGLWQTVVI